MTVRCPICKGSVAGRATNGAFPFCGERCRLVDLGNWLGETYRVPAEERADEAPGAEDATPAASSPSARRDKRTS